MPKNKLDTQELSEHIAAVVKAIEEGLPIDRRLEGGIEFEISTILRKEARGGMKIFIAEAGGKYSTAETSKIKFKIK